MKYCVKNGEVPVAPLQSEDESTSGTGEDEVLSQNNGEVPVAPSESEDESMVIDGHPICEKSKHGNIPTIPQTGTKDWSPECAQQLIDQKVHGIILKLNMNNQDRVIKFI